MDHERKKLLIKKTGKKQGIDGIQNFWWKKFKPAQKALRKAFADLYVDTAMIHAWWLSGRTVLLPKIKSLNDEKNYRPIACFNTSYNILTGLVMQHMREHTAVNEIWDEGQLEPVEDELGTVDHLIINRCIMKEIKKHQ